MRKILALLSHGDAELGPAHVPVAGSAGGGSGAGSGSSVGLLPGKQVAIDNQRFVVDSIIAEGMCLPLLSPFVVIFAFFTQANLKHGRLALNHTKSTCSLSVSQFRP